MQAQLNTHQIHETVALTVPQSALATVLEQTARQVFENFSDKLKATLNGRQERALKLAMEGHVSHKSGRIFSVRSENGQHSYLVDLARSFCNCPDSQQGHVCKHRLAAYLVEQSTKPVEDIPMPVEENPPAPNPHSQPELVPQPDDPLDKVRLIFKANSPFLRSAIIYAVLRLENEPLLVEILELDGQLAFVRALPKLIEENLIPQFPFPEKQSAAFVLAASLTNVRIYR